MRHVVVRVRKDNGEVYVFHADNMWCASDHDGNDYIVLEIDSKLEDTTEHWLYMCYAMNCSGQYQFDDVTKTTTIIVEPSRILNVKSYYAAKV